MLELFFIVIHMYKGPFIYENDVSVQGLSIKTPRKKKWLLQAVNHLEMDFLNW